MSILSPSAVSRRLSASAASLAVAVALCAGLIASEASAAPVKTVAPPPVQSQQQDVRSVLLPRHCAFEAGSRRNPALVLSERCLRDSGVRGRLPQQCVYMVPGRGPRAERAYEARCMANRGFVMAKPARPQPHRFDAPQRFDAPRPPRYY